MKVCSATLKCEQAFSAKTHEALPPSHQYMPEFVKMQVQKIDLSYSTSIELNKDQAILPKFTI